MKLFVWYIANQQKYIYILANTVEEARLVYYFNKENFNYGNIHSEPDSIFEKPTYFEIEKYD